MSTTVALDIISLRGAGADRGLGRYAATLVDALEKYSDNLIVPVTLKEGDRESDPRASGRALRQALNSSDAVYHSTSPWHLPWRKNVPWVCSIQDTIPLDLSSYTKLGLRTKAHFKNARRADTLVANSSYTASRIAHHLDRPIEEIPICPLPVNRSFVDNGGDLASVLDARTVALLDGQPYVVALADYRSHDPRKRFHWIEDLVPFVGQSGMRMVIVHRSAAQPNSNEDAIYLRNLDDRQLAAVYANATATYYPSAYEGQGLPPLEAMATGCPVVAFRNSSVQEVVAKDEFLIEDPVPWEQGRLDASLPADAARAIVDRVEDWARDPGLLARLRRDAKGLATAWSAASLARCLDEVYRKVDHRWRT